MDITFLIYLNRLTAIYGVVCKMEKVIFDNFKRTFLTPSVMERLNLLKSGGRGWGE